MNSSFIYPGQQLLVPDKSATNSGETTEDNDSNASIKDSPATTDKIRKLSAEESQNEDKEKGKGKRDKIFSICIYIH